MRKDKVKTNTNNKKLRSGRTRERSGSSAPKYESADKPYPSKGSSKFGSKTCTTDSYNDASWYASNPQLLKDSASFSYNSPLGAPFRMDTLMGTTTNNVWKRSRYTSTIPGLMSIHIVPTIGVSTDAQSPINIAAQNIYSYVRYNNSGAANYDAPDLMLYLVAMNSTYSAWNWCKRLYGCVNSYSQMNRYMPRAYVEANGVDFDDLIANLSDFRAFLNVTAAKISAFCVPAVMSYFVRQSWLYANIYKDSDTLKAQQYIFVPGLFYQYDETSSPKGGILSPITVAPEKIAEADLLKVSEVKAILTNMIDALQYSEDIGIMSGDILKAYGESKLFKLGTVEPDYRVEPVYNEEVLNQIHNLTIVSIDTKTQPFPNFKITQDPNTNWILWNPSFATLGGTIRDGALLNMPWQDVSPENTMVASRLTSVTGQSGSGTLMEFKAVGSEFVNAVYIWFYAAGADDADMTASPVYTSMRLHTVRLTQDIFFAKEGTSIPTALGQTMFENLAKLALVSQFDWHPLIQISVRDLTTSPTPAGAYNVVAMLGDMNNYTIIGLQQFEMLELTALMSMFGVPQIGPSF